MNKVAVLVPRGHDYASTQIQIPADLAGVIRRLGRSIPDEDLYTVEKETPEASAWNYYGRETDYHITVKYGIKSDDIEEARRIVARHDPFEITFSTVSFFTGDPDYDVVKVDVKSPELRKLNAAISKGLDCIDAYPTYNPHATIAYINKGTTGNLAGNELLKDKKFYATTVMFCDRSGHKTPLRLRGLRELDKTAAMILPAIWGR